jgi:hypothetical protein
MNHYLIILHPPGSFGFRPSVPGEFATIVACRQKMPTTTCQEKTEPIFPDARRVESKSLHLEAKPQHHFSILPEITT